jgi:hypothetical protein
MNSTGTFIRDAIVIIIRIVSVQNTVVIVIIVI